MDEKVNFIDGSTLTHVNRDFDGLSLPCWDVTLKKYVVVDIDEFRDHLMQIFAGELVINAGYIERLAGITDRSDINSDTTTDSADVKVYYSTVKKKCVFEAAGVLYATHTSLQDKYNDEVHQTVRQDKIYLMPDMTLYAYNKGMLVKLYDFKPTQSLGNAADKIPSEKAVYDALVESRKTSDTNYLKINSEGKAIPTSTDGTFADSSQIKGASGKSVEQELTEQQNGIDAANTAATDANAKADGLSTRVTKLEQGGGIVPDTEVIAGSNNAVSGNAVYNEVQNLSNTSATMFKKVLYTTYNLLDVDFITVESRIDANKGTITTEAGWNLSDFIPVEESQEYSYFSDLLRNQPRWYAFDADKKYLGVENFKVAKSYVIPQGCKYVRISYFAKETDNMVVKGNKELPYLPSMVIKAVTDERIIQKLGYNSEMIVSQKAITDYFDTLFKKTYNLFDERDVIKGVYLGTNSGKEAADTGRNSSGFIDVVEGKIYSSQNGDNPIIVNWYAYDADKNYIQDSYKVSVTSYTVPAGAKYVRISYLATEKVMVLEGNELKPYLPCRYLNLNDINISELKNDIPYLEEKEFKKFVERSYNLFNIDSLCRETYLSANNGLPTENTTRDTSDFIEVKEGTDYYFQVKEQEKNLVCRWYAFDADKKYMGVENFKAAKSYVTPQGCKYVRISIERKDYPVSEIMVSEGTTRKDYVPFEILKTSGKLSCFENDVPFVKQLVQNIVLPDKLYAFANREVILNLPNVVLYSWDDVYCRIYTSNNGAISQKQWRFTPDKAMELPCRLQIFDHYSNPLVEQSFTLVVKDKSIKNELKVLVIGDSTVNHHHETQKMLDLAAEDGYSLTLLGTRGLPDSPNRHEGRGGWTAEMYCNRATAAEGRVINEFYNPDTKTFDFAYYMANMQKKDSLLYDHVDCVFLQLGINDLFAPKTDEELQNALNSFFVNFDKMVESIVAYDSNIKIIINLTIPCSQNQDTFSEVYGVSQTVWTAKRNTFILNKKIIERYNNRPNVYLSWYNAAIDIYNDMERDVHPKKSGYDTLGTQMYMFMRAVC